MKDWRKLSSTEMDWKDSEDYDKKVGMNVPFSATFTGDKLPSSGDPAKKEVNDYKSQNKEFMKDVKKENKNLSPIFNRKESVEEHMKKSDKEVKASSNWRESLGAVDFKSKPDGTVEINYTQENSFEESSEGGEGTDNSGLEYQPTESQEVTYQIGDDVVNTQSSIRGKVVGLTTTSAKVDLFLETGKSSITEWPLTEIQHLNPSRRASKKTWTIRESKLDNGKLVLLGSECADRACIEIREITKTGSRVIDRNIVDKNGNDWKELINQAVWESRFDNYLQR